jgi:type 1 glutamine amidotransferase
VPQHILIFSKTTGFRHDSIEAATTAIRDIVASSGTVSSDTVSSEYGGITADATEDAGAFTDDNLTKYDALAFLSTTGELFDDTQRSALERFVRAGGGFAGIHAASNGEPEWPFFGDLIGARFDGHPEIQQATISVADSGHPATAHLSRPWVWTDEWYNFTTQPRGNVLLTVDEATYTGGTMGTPHPIAWSHEVDAGRCFYTSLGHAAEYYDDPAFRAHLLGGIASVM